MIPPVEMTNLLQGSCQLSSGCTPVHGSTNLSSRPERSAVERSAVSFRFSRTLFSPCPDPLRPPAKRQRSPEGLGWRHHHDPARPSLTWERHRRGTRNHPPLKFPLTEPGILFHSRDYRTMPPVETTTQRPVSGVPITMPGIRHREREVFHFELMLKGIYLVRSPAEV
jgi:hypothetical protein